MPLSVASQVKLTIGENAVQRVLNLLANNEFTMPNKIIQHLCFGLVK